MEFAPHYVRVALGGMISDYITYSPYSLNRRLVIISSQGTYESSGAVN